MKLRLVLTALATTAAASARPFGVPEVSSTLPLVGATLIGAVLLARVLRR